MGIHCASPRELAPVQHLKLGQPPPHPDGKNFTNKTKQQFKPALLGASFAGEAAEKHRVRGWAVLTAPSYCNPASWSALLALLVELCHTLHTTRRGWPFKRPGTVCHVGKLGWVTVVNALHPQQLPLAQFFTRVHGHVLGVSPIAPHMNHSSQMQGYDFTDLESRRLISPWSLPTANTSK